MNPEEEYGVVITTFSDEKSMKECIEGLLSEHLAACVQQIQGKSSYRWEGAVQHEDEFIVLIKTLGDLFPRLEAYIKAHHPYDVPEIVYLPITKGSSEYLSWMKDECLVGK